jgi:hypothetical protein
MGLRVDVDGLLGPVELTPWKKTISVKTKNRHTSMEMTMSSSTPIRLEVVTIYRTARLAMC